METTTEQPLSWPAPLPPPGPFQGFWALARFATEHLFFSRRTLLVGLIAALPVLLAAAAAAAKSWLPIRGLGDPAALYGILYTFFYTHVLLLLLPLLYGTGLISDEVEAQTLTCLLTRPISKTVVLLAKFAAYCVVAAMLAGPSLVLCYALLNTGLSGLPELTQRAQLLLQDLAVLGAGLVVYGAVFAFFGVALKRPLLVGLLYGVWESVFAYAPGLFHRFTLLHYLQANSRIASEYGWILALVRESTAPDEARLTLLLAFLAVLTLCIVVFRRREYRLGGTENA
jgi:ABC-2 family transporter